MNQNLHREDAKNAKKDKNKKENAVACNKMGFFLSFSPLCVLRVFAVQGFLILQYSLRAQNMRSYNL
jgi:hypothetical protein